MTCAVLCGIYSSGTFLSHVATASRETSALWDARRGPGRRSSHGATEPWGTALAWGALYVYRGSEARRGGEQWRRTLRAGASSFHTPHHTFEAR